MSAMHVPVAATLILVLHCTVHMLLSFRLQSDWGVSPDHAYD